MGKNGGKEGKNSVAQSTKAKKKTLRALLAPKLVVPHCSLLVHFFGGGVRVHPETYASPPHGA